MTTAPPTLMQLARDRDARARRALARSQRTAVPRVASLMETDARARDAVAHAYRAGGLELAERTLSREIRSKAAGRARTRTEHRAAWKWTRYVLAIDTAHLREAAEEGLLGDVITAEDRAAIATARAQARVEALEELARNGAQVSPDELDDEGPELSHDELEELEAQRAELLDAAR